MSGRMETGEWRNGRRAGLRSRCPVRGVSVRPRPRPPWFARGTGPGRRWRLRVLAHAPSGALAPVLAAALAGPRPASRSGSRLGAPSEAARRPMFATAEPIGRIAGRTGRGRTDRGPGRPAGALALSVGASHEPAQVAAGLDRAVAARWFRVDSGDRFVNRERRPVLGGHGGAYGGGHGGDHGGAHNVHGDAHKVPRDASGPALAERARDPGESARARPYTSRRCPPP